MVRSLKKNGKFTSQLVNPLIGKFRQRVFIKDINTDNLCEDFGNISNDNKRQRTIMCPYKDTMDVVSYCRLVVCRIVCFYLTT